MAEVKPQHFSIQNFVSYLKKFGRNDQVILSVLALVIGVAAGLAEIAFRAGIGFVQKLGYGFSSEKVASLAAELPWWQLLLVPSAGGLVIGCFIHFFMPGRRPQSSPPRTHCARGPWSTPRRAAYRPPPAVFARPWSSSPFRLRPDGRLAVDRCG